MGDVILWNSWYKSRFWLFQELALAGSCRCRMVTCSNCLSCTRQARKFGRTGRGIDWRGTVCWKWHKTRKASRPSRSSRRSATSSEPSTLSCTWWMPLRQQSQVKVIQHHLYEIVQRILLLYKEFYCTFVVSGNLGMIMVTRCVCKTQIPLPSVQQNMNEILNGLRFDPNSIPGGCCVLWC